MLTVIAHYTLKSAGDHIHTDTVTCALDDLEGVIALRHYDDPSRSDEVEVVSTKIIRTCS